jgi:hypothetical protein
MTPAILNANPMIIEKISSFKGKITLLHEKIVQYKKHAPTSLGNTRGNH